MGCFTSVLTPVLQSTRLDYLPGKVGIVVLYAILTLAQLYELILSRYLRYLRYYLLYLTDCLLPFLFSFISSYISHV